MKEILTALLRQSGGRITFAQFMQVALYQKDIGYYMQTRSPIGIGGDFYTAVSATPVFGRILAGYFQRMLEQLGDRENGVIVEYGGHRGQLRADIHSVIPSADYRIVEVDDPDPDRISGIVFCNELLDALPVHRVKVVGGRWTELYVVQDGDVFGWSPGPVSDPSILRSLEGLPVASMEGYETEVGLQVAAWVRRVGAKLARGRMVIIDYGHERPAYYAPERPRGTLRCFYRHTLYDNPFTNIGGQDITASVDFTAVMEAGESAGLKTVLFTDLGRFLVREGESVLREISEREAGRPSRERQGLHQLLHPGLMGSAFKVLVMEKSGGP